jgi:hypothetical protein
MGTVYVGFTTANTQFLDTFNRADGAVGTDWITLPPGTAFGAGPYGATAQVKSNIFTTVGASSSASSVPVIVNPATKTFSANQSVEVVTTDLNGGSSAPLAQIFLRMSSYPLTLNGYSGYSIRVDPNLTLTIIRVDATAGNTILNTGVSPIALNSKVKAEISGYTISVYVNDVLTLSATDTDTSNRIASGQPGVLFLGFSNSGGFDYFLAKDL